MPDVTNDTGSLRLNLSIDRDYTQWSPNNFLSVFDVEELYLPVIMRTVLTLSRQCLRPSISRAAQQVRPLRTSAFRDLLTKRAIYHPPPSRNGKGQRIIWAAAVAALSPAVFVQLSETDNDGTEQTAEGRMLQASRDEIAKKLRDDDHGISRVRHGIILYLDIYIWEPLCTGLRFLHLVAIFVPVILSVPAIWIGNRDKTRDNERSGTLWWYWFLVKSMERGGPAFIKVRRFSMQNSSAARIGFKAPRPLAPNIKKGNRLIVIARTMGSIKIRYLSNRNV